MVVASGDGYKERRVTLFRPCIDLHDGRVKQIVGGTLRDSGAGPQENYVAEQPAEWFARRYREDGLAGGHVIQLGPGNRDAALSALAEFPGGLQLGGGVTDENARQWLDAGASQVIVTSFLFEEGKLSDRRLERMANVVRPSELVIDLSCRRTERGWNVATNRWQTVTDTPVDASLVQKLTGFCCEVLVHAADVEGLCRGIDEDLVRHLAEICDVPCTYAGGGRSLDDLERVRELSSGAVDLTFGSALDLFGGNLVRYADCVAWNRRALEG